MRAAVLLLPAALAAVARDHPLPPVLLGHSTGGLVASLWADRNPGRLAALASRRPAAGSAALADALPDLPETW